MAGEGDCIRLDSLEKDFNFNLALASEKFDLMPDVLDRMKTKRWVNRLKLEPTEGHTDCTRRTRNAYLKLVLISLQNGVLDPRLDMEPPPRHNPLCVLEIPDCNLMPDWLDVVAAATESKVMMEAGGEGQCYLAAKTFENGGACGYVAVTTGKDEWLTPLPEREDLSFIISDRKKSADPCDSASASETKSAQSEEQPVCSEDEDEPASPQQNEEWSVPCEAAVYYDVSHLDALQSTFPEMVVDEFKDGVHQKKKEIRKEALTKLGSDAKQAVLEAKAIVKSTLGELRRYKLALADLKEMEQKLRLCDQLHNARVEELQRRAISRGFAGIVNCGCIENLVADNKELEEDKRKVACSIKKLDQEWESLQVRLSINDLREAMDFATQQVKNIVCQPQPKTTCPFNSSRINVDIV